MELISSVNNEKVKFAVKIASSSKARKENKMFFLEGLRLCQDAVIAQVEIMQTFVSEQILQKNEDDLKDLIASSQNVYVIKSEVAKKISLTQSNQGVFCVCKMPKDKDMQSFDFKSKCIALDNVQDPSNLGAIVRTAQALGINSIITSKCCDLYNPKAQRAAMGCLSRMPIFDCNDLIETLNLCEKNGMKLYATTPNSSAENITEIDFSKPCISVIGNEANGVSDEVLTKCEKITIPMLGRAESLNAAMAATITMWEMTKQ